MSAQIIEKDGKPEYAVLPYDEYVRLVEDAEMVDDLRLFDEATATPEEKIPAEVVDRLINGESPIKVWREFRRLTQPEVAKVANISVPYLSQLENGDRAGSVDVLKAIAERLNITVDDLI